MHFLLLLPSQKEVLLLVELFFLSVSPFVCGHYSKSYECIAMKFCGDPLGGVVKNRLDFGGDLGVLR